MSDRCGLYDAAHASLPFSGDRGRRFPTPTIGSLFSLSSVTHTRSSGTAPTPPRRSSKEDEQPAHPIEEGVQGMSMCAFGPGSPLVLFPWCVHHVSHVCVRFSCHRSSVPHHAYFTELFAEQKLCSTAVHCSTGIPANGCLAFRGRLCIVVARWRESSL